MGTDAGYLAGWDQTTASKASLVAKKQALAFLMPKSRLAEPSRTTGLAGGG